MYLGSEVNSKITKVNNHKYSISIDGSSIGYIETYENKFHSSNCYLRPNLIEYEKMVASRIFDEISRQEDKPLQMMLNASDKEKIAFIKSGGFVCKRKCYNMAVTIDDLIYRSDQQVALNYCQYGSDEYKQCASLMYHHYKQTHQKINPLTASCEDFKSILPKSAFYQKCHSKIESVIFVKDNEIAYICLSDTENALDFAYAVICELFNKHSCIVFECDHIDNSAMRLASMFNVDLNSSYNTYIREKNSIKRGKHEKCLCNRR